MDERQQQEIAQAFDATPELVPFIPELLADLWEMGGSVEVIVDMLRPLSLPAETTRILDLGCGPGRDLIYFKSLGHRPVGLDGSSAFCEMAREHSGCPVLHQQFLHMNLPDKSFDGIFANASLFHVPSQELLRIIQELHAALRSEGILFTSNPRGSVEGWSGQRYGNYMEFEVTKAYLEAAGFVVLDYYYRPPGQPCAAQPWLAIVSQKAG